MGKDGWLTQRHTYSTGILLLKPDTIVFTTILRISTVVTPNLNQIFSIKIGPIFHGFFCIIIIYFSLSLPPSRFCLLSSDDGQVQ